MYVLGQNNSVYKRYCKIKKIYKIVSYKMNFPCSIKKWSLRNITELLCFLIYPCLPFLFISAKKNFIFKNRWYLHICRVIILIVFYYITFIVIKHPWQIITLNIHVFRIILSEYLNLYFNTASHKYNWMTQK